jgi:hypothetical protein
MSRSFIARMFLEAFFLVPFCDFKSLIILPFRNTANGGWIQKRENSACNLPKARSFALKCDDQPLPSADRIWNRTLWPRIREIVVFPLSIDKIVSMREKTEKTEATLSWVCEMRCDDMEAPQSWRCKWFIFNALEIPSLNDADLFSRLCLISSSFRFTSSKVHQTGTTASLGGSSHCPTWSWLLAQPSFPFLFTCFTNTSLQQLLTSHLAD